MRLVLQRVKSASVTVEGKCISSIDSGVLALVGIHELDTEADAEYCCKKLLGTKLWENNSKPWRHGVKQKQLQVLCVSQFTLYGSVANKKHQPDYKLAMKPDSAERLYDIFLGMLRDNYEEDKIYNGQFGAMMDVALVNDGPVTVVVESGPLAVLQKQQQQQTENGDVEVDQLS